MEVRPISFREKMDIIEKIDELANKRGTDRSALIREFIRNELERIRFKKDL
jgi:predicted transcriptional regulator